MKKFFLSALCLMTVAAMAGELYVSQSVGKKKGFERCCILGGLLVVAGSDGHQIVMLGLIALVLLPRCAREH